MQHKIHPVKNAGIAWTSLEQGLQFGYIPHTIRRISDDVLFVLNNDNETYSMKDDETIYPRIYKAEHIHNPDYFEICSWINIKNLEKFYGDE